MDNYFKSRIQKLHDMAINLNTSFISEHVPEVKYQNQVLKYCFCACHHKIPFKYINKLMGVYIIMYGVLWFINSQTKEGVSITDRPN